MVEFLNETEFKGNIDLSGLPDTYIKYAALIFGPLIVLEF